MASQHKVGFTTKEWPGFPKATALGFQLYLAIFAATVFVPLVTHFYVSAALFMSGVATLAALFVTKGRIPLYYGSSFAAIYAIVQVVERADTIDEGIRVAQAGIIVAGLVQVVVGYIIRKRDPAVILRVFPPEIIGAVALVIAYGLFGAAINMASGLCCLRDSAGNPVASGKWWLVAAVTALTTATLAYLWHNKHGIWGKLPIIWGGLAGVIAGALLGINNPGAFDNVSVFTTPDLSLPLFTHDLIFMSIASITFVTIATVAESIAHYKQIREVEVMVAKELGKEVPDSEDLTGLNVVADGVGDVVNGLGGGVMGTNYGEGISTMLTSSSTTFYAVIVAALIAILTSTIGYLDAVFGYISMAIVGGWAFYLFPTFGAVGLKMMAKVGLEYILHPRVLAVTFPILVLGIGGGNAYGGAVPFPLSGWLEDLMPGGIPAIAIGTLIAITLNLLLPKRVDEAQQKVDEVFTG